MWEVLRQRCCGLGQPKLQKLAFAAYAEIQDLRRRRDGAMKEDNLEFENEQDERWSRGNDIRGRPKPKLGGVS
jgi:hypothetical protein